ncbi:hypothetical protein HPNQ4161_0172 [Helicobacter pylori NQ4161]|nr:hypothetical protein HPNQ4161_0172 [Helicobacter pylori NQ4161]
MAFGTKRHTNFKIFKMRSKIPPTNKKNPLTTKDQEILRMKQRIKTSKWV